MDKQIEMKFSVGMGYGLWTRYESRSESRSGIFYHFMTDIRTHVLYFCCRECRFLYSNSSGGLREKHVYNAVKCLMSV